MTQYETQVTDSVVGHIGDCKHATQLNFIG